MDIIKLKHSHEKGALSAVMIEWKDDMSVGIEEFDFHHKRIIDLINRLCASLETGDELKVTEEALAELSNYCFYHFFAEEDAMGKYAFPGYVEHREEHLKFIEKIFQLIADFHGKEKSTARELRDFLWTWLRHHILVTDKKHTEVLRAGGMS
jgi:hemerythrin